MRTQSHQNFLLALTCFTVLSHISSVEAALPNDFKGAMNYLIKREDTHRLMDLLTCQEVTDPENTTIKKSPQFKEKQGPTNEEFLLMMKGVEVIVDKDLGSGKDPLPRLDGDHNLPRLLGATPSTPLSKDQADRYHAHLFLIMLSQKYFKERRTNPFFSDPSLQDADLKSHILEKIVTDFHTRPTQHHDAQHYLKSVENNKKISPAKSRAFLARVNALVERNSGIFKTSIFSWGEENLKKITEKKHTGSTTRFSDPLSVLKDEARRAANLWFNGKADKYAKKTPDGKGRDLNIAYSRFSTSRGELEAMLNEKLKTITVVTPETKKDMLRILQQFIGGMWLKKKTEIAPKQPQNQNQGPAWQQTAQDIASQGEKIVEKVNMTIQDNQQARDNAEIEGWANEIISNAFANKFEKLTQQEKETIQQQLHTLLKKLRDKDLFDFEFLFATGDPVDYIASHFSATIRGKSYAEINAGIAEYTHKLEVIQAQKKRLDAIGAKLQATQITLNENIFSSEKPCISTGLNHFYSPSEEAFFRNKRAPDPVTNMMYFPQDQQSFNRIVELITGNNIGAVHMSSTPVIDRYLVKVRDIEGTINKPIFKYLRIEVSNIPNQQNHIHVKAIRDTLNLINSGTYEPWIETSMGNWDLFAVPTIQNKTGKIILLTRPYDQFQKQNLFQVQDIYNAYHPK